MKSQPSQSPSETPNSLVERKRPDKIIRWFYVAAALTCLVPCSWILAVPALDAAEMDKYPIGAKLNDLHIVDGPNSFFHNEDALTMPSLAGYLKQHRDTSSIRLIASAPGKTPLEVSVYDGRVQYLSGTKSGADPQDPFHEIEVGMKLADLAKSHHYNVGVNWIGEERTTVFDTPARAAHFTGSVQIESNTSNPFDFKYIFLDVKDGVIVGRRREHY